MRIMQKQGYAAVAVAVASLALVGAGVALSLRTTYRTPAPVGALPMSSPVITAFTPSTPPTARVKVHTPRASPPEHVSAPTQGISAAVVPVGVSSTGALEVPEDIHTVGWWAGSARPGASRGTVVLAGHVDSKTQGHGAFFPLERLEPGNRVTVTTARGSLSYIVKARRSYAKPALPRSVFAQTAEPGLVLITCGGQFDERTGSYADNIVVYAVPA
jgi:hypothetical protein